MVNGQKTDADHQETADLCEQSAPREDSSALAQLGEMHAAGRNTHEKLRRLIQTAQEHPAISVAVAEPCDRVSLEGVIEASRLNLIVPILVGPQERIDAVARELGLDISQFEIVDAGLGQDAAAVAVGLVRNGRAEALMKGSLHTDDLMRAVVSRADGLRTTRRISHCFVMDVPGHPDPLIITDAAINIAPDLACKADIIRNATGLAQALGQREVRVAILSAIENVNPDIPSSIEAAALCKMADRGQITGAIVDGPLAFDNAINLQAARIKKIDSPVAGRANVLVVPDLEAGNMLAKSLSFLAGADSAGIVLGAKVPIILTSRADAQTTRLASCAIAQMLVAARKSDPAAAID